MESNGRNGSPSSLLVYKKELKAERHFLLVKLAECANRIKIIDEQLKSI